MTIVHTVWGRNMARPPLTGKQIAAVAAGNALEFYDFVTYSFFAVQIGRSLFPGDASQSLILSLATSESGSSSRPLGGLIIGRMADRRGRKPAMILSFTLMGIGIVGLALTPSYRVDRARGLDPRRLFRLLQGFALGGEVGPNAAFLMEAAPPHRRGFYLSIHLATADVCSLRRRDRRARAFVAADAAAARRLGMAPRLPDRSVDRPVRSRPSANARGNAAGRGPGAGARRAASSHCCSPRARAC